MGALLQIVQQSRRFCLAVRSSIGASQISNKYRTISGPSNRLSQFRDRFAKHPFFNVRLGQLIVGKGKPRVHLDSLAALPYRFVGKLRDEMKLRQIGVDHPGNGIQIYRLIHFRNRLFVSPHQAQMPGIKRTEFYAAARCRREGLNAGAICKQGTATVGWVTTNTCLDYLRKARPRRESDTIKVSLDGMEQDLLDQVADDRPANDPERELVRRELRACILCALRQLTPHERMVFDMKHFQGMKLRAVGEILNISEGSVKTSLVRATRKLRLHLASYTQQQNSSMKRRRPHLNFILSEIA
jgi:RNA polymerase sigma factor (sigma-70 family)